MVHLVKHSLFSPETIRDVKRRIISIQIPTLYPRRWIKVQLYLLGHGSIAIEGIRKVHGRRKYEHRLHKAEGGAHFVSQNLSATNPSAINTDPNEVSNLHLQLSSNLTRNMKRQVTNRGTERYASRSSTKSRKNMCDKLIQGSQDCPENRTVQFLT